jgi:hypothetical protein
MKAPHLKILPPKLEALPPGNRIFPKRNNFKRNFQVKKVCCWGNNGLKLQALPYWQMIDLFMLFVNLARGITAKDYGVKNKMMV